MTAASNRRLNELVITLGRSLLQYVGEAWPWTASDPDATRQEIERLVAEQQHDVERLVDLLQDRQEAVDFGGYPTDFTSLHFLSLDYLLDRIITSEESIVEDLSVATTGLTNDEPAAALVTDIHSRELKRLETLRNLATTHTAPA